MYSIPFFPVASCFHHFDNSMKIFVKEIFPIKHRCEKLCLIRFHPKAVLLDALDFLLYAFTEFWKVRSEIEAIFILVFNRVINTATV